MCRAVKCRECGKTTWSGCGQHVDQVMKNVPRSDRCEGHGSTGANSGPGGFLGRLFGR